MIDILASGASLIIVLVGAVLLALLARRLIGIKTGRHYIVAVGILLLAISSILGFFLVTFSLQQSFYSVFAKIIDVAAIIYIVYGI